MSQTPDIGGALQWFIDLAVGFSTDFFAFIVIAALVAAFAFYLGRDRILPLLAGMYAAVPLYLSFPYQEFLTTPLLSIALFVAFVLAGMVAFSGLSAFIASESVGFVKLATLSALTAGMLIALSIHVLPVEQLYTFSTPTRALFASAEAYFFWLLAPLVGVYLFSRG